MPCPPPTALSHDALPPRVYGHKARWHLHSGTSGRFHGARRAAVGDEHTARVGARRLPCTTKLMASTTADVEEDTQAKSRTQRIMEAMPTEKQAMGAGGSSTYQVLFNGGEGGARFEVGFMCVIRPELGRTRAAFRITVGALRGIALGGDEQTVVDCSVD